MNCILPAEHYPIRAKYFSMLVHKGKSERALVPEEQLCENSMAF